MKKTARGKWWLVVLTGLVLIVIGGYAAWAVTRPLPELKPSSSSLQIQIKPRPSSLVWPSTGQSAVGIIGSNVLETHGSQTPAPTASTAKIITALVVLKQKPLTTGQQGPTLILNANDQAIYDAYAASGGSVVPVQAGEQISEYQMLEAILLPSANNLADSLATWAFGSLPAYSTAANTYLKQLGLNGTTVGSDASGFSPTTVSTAHDLVRLGELAMQDPVLAGVVGQSTASGIPLAGTVKNVNSLLGTSGIIGVKTGNTDQAGGVFISASRAMVNQKPVTIVTALLGSSSLWQSLHDSLPLVQSAQANFKPVTVVKAGDVLGSYRVPWSGTIQAVAGQELSLQTWNGSKLSATLNLPVINSRSKAQQTLSTLNVSDPITGYKNSVSVKLNSSPRKPTLWWHLTHP